MTQPKFGILITTKNRIEDLKFTLSKISHLIHRPDVECIIWDDGSSDNTYDYIKNNKSTVLENLFSPPNLLNILTIQSQATA